jgi:hypothetical protein
MWRIISLVIIGFWLVMTSLLVRYVWFPEGTQFSEVPPSVVFRRFLQQGSAMSTASSLLIYQRDKKIGTANLRCTHERASDYILRLECFFDKGAFPLLQEKVILSLSLKLLNFDQFSDLTGKLRVEQPPIINGKVRLTQAPKVVDFSWKKGELAPVVNGAEDAGINTTMIQAMVAQAMLGGGIAGLQGMPKNPPAPATSALDASSILQVRARERIMDFAGQKSQGHLLEFTVMERWKARAFITEAGEFVLMDLPEGYRLVEPVIHGLAPEYDEEDEEAQIQRINERIEKKE